jgi:hypothetical protein
MRIVDALPAPVAQPEAGFWASGIASLDKALAGGLGMGRSTKSMPPSRTMPVRQQALSRALPWACAWAVAGRRKRPGSPCSGCASSVGPVCGHLAGGGWAELGARPAMGWWGSCPIPSRCARLPRRCIVASWARSYWKGGEPCGRSTLQPAAAWSSLLKNRVFPCCSCASMPGLFPVRRARAGRSHRPLRGPCPAMHRACPHST